MEDLDAYKLWAILSKALACVQELRKIEGYEDRHSLVIVEAQIKHAIACCNRQIDKEYI